MSTTITNPLAAFPEAPIPTTLPEALRLLGETRCLMNEHGIPRRHVPAPSTMRDALEQLAVDRESLAEALRAACTCAPHYAFCRLHPGSE